MRPQTKWIDLTREAAEAVPPGMDVIHQPTFCLLAGLFSGDFLVARADVGGDAKSLGDPVHLFSRLAGTTSIRSCAASRPIDVDNDDGQAWCSALNQAQGNPLRWEGRAEETSRGLSVYRSLARGTSSISERHSKPLTATQIHCLSAEL